MSKKLLSSLFAVVAFSVVGCGSDDSNDSAVKQSEPKHNVDYYIANPKLAYSVVDECKTQIATIADHEKVFAQGDCKNAMLAKKQIIKMRNNPNNAKPTFDFSNTAKTEE